MLRRLAVLKLWQVRDPFDTEAFFTKLRTAAYDWDDLQRLVRASERIEPNQVLAAVEDRFVVLRHLTDLERRVINDAKSEWNEFLAEQLRAEITQVATEVLSRGVRRWYLM